MAWKKLAMYAQRVTNSDRSENKLWYRRPAQDYDLMDLGRPKQDLDRRRTWKWRRGRRTTLISTSMFRRFLPARISIIDMGIRTVPCDEAWLLYSSYRTRHNNQHMSVCVCVCVVFMENVRIQSLVHVYLFIEFFHSVLLQDYFRSPWYGLRDITECGIGSKDIILKKSLLEEAKKSQFYQVHQVTVFGNFFHVMVKWSANIDNLSIGSTESSKTTRYLTHSFVCTSRSYKLALIYILAHWLEFRTTVSTRSLWDFSK